MEIRNLSGQVILTVPGDNLKGANLREANLRKADLREADLSLANLRWANLRRANLIRADLRWALLPDDVPIVPNIDKAILGTIAQEGYSLDMAHWHTCTTTHCRAGWAIHLAGKAGYALEKRFGPSVAGALIYAASGSHPVPDWLASDKEAIVDMEERARIAAQGDQKP